MEELLPQCLDSLVLSSAAAELDVVVVNDGSRDSSLTIANRYAERYRDVVRVIDKPNGNYGSTINAALPTLKGEYVKILDADDTFDCQAIAPFVEYLERVSGADMVVAPFIELDFRGERRVDYNIYSRKVYGYGVPYSAEQIFADGEIKYFMMHSVAYRTEMLQQMNYHQTEGISYTDQQWCFYPIFKVESVAFTDIALYRYNLAREGQTMQASIQLRRIDQLRDVVVDMAKYLRQNREGLSDIRVKFLEGVVVRRMQTVLRKYLLDMSSTQFASSDFFATLELLDSLAPQPLTVPLNGLLRFDMLAFARKHNRRYREWLRKSLRGIDMTMGAIYRLLWG